MGDAAVNWVSSPFLGPHLGRRYGLLLLGILIVLVGCAGQTAAPVAMRQTPVVAARLHQGTVVGVRRLDLSNEPGALLGVNAVLAALRENATGSATAQEIVVREADDSPVSIVQQNIAPPGFAVGDHVTIAEGGTTALVRGN